MLLVSMSEPRFVCRFASLPIQLPLLSLSMGINRFAFINICMRVALQFTFFERLLVYKGAATCESVN